MTHPTTPSPQQIKSLLHEALSVSHHATQLDTNQQSDPIHILSLYTESSHRIEHIMPFLPREYSVILGKFAKVYLERANRLRDEIRASMDSEDVIVQEVQDSEHVTGAQTLEEPVHKTHVRSRSKSLGIKLGNIKKAMQTGPETPHSRRVTPSSLNEASSRIQFHEIEIPKLSPTDEATKVPQNWVHRPFWLMRLLSRSMRDGAHISRNLYIARDVWYQNANQKLLMHLNAKVQFCERLYILLKELNMFEENLYAETNQIQNLANLDERLVDFMKQAEREHDTLSKAIQSSKSKKMFGIGKIYSKVFSGKAQVGTGGGGASQENANASGSSSTGSVDDSLSTVYVPVLIKLLDQCQYVDKWYTHVEKLSTEQIDEQLATQIKNVRQSLESVSMFLYLRLCSFVLSDTHTLLECYLRQMRDSFEELTM